jgi:hypothetical protein
MNNLNIKVNGAKLLYPVYDMNKNIIDVLPFEEKYLLNYTNKQNLIHGLSTLFNKSKYFEKTGICVTNSILDCIAIYERTGIPCIVLSSLDIKNDV